ncbi:zinc finger protein CONSTANS-LIKE 16 [Dendrobium catenatum]|uniref:Zinc finger protein CONSTANS-LIKE 16 n=1 Tax=Dendrobium catenatum TaxID=906689 RepID=A0A2I0W2X3_9ASPA|nr:zinc finger protein CONSTANS-LIKE 16 [Dendrobium catenatum]PKU69988.1 Zinc finger protein CONSTANS-LIKE 16 [Dendrobium catenatum]
MDERDRKHRSAANAVGGSTARACDGCLRRRARWYCGADDAFLCQACDSSVHSANSLARRHQRLRLHTASFSSSPSPSPSPTPPPISWRKRKARTPRGHHQPKSVKPEPLVPDLEKEDEELEMQLMCCVPVLDPLFNDFSSASLEAKPISGYGLDAGPGGPSIEIDMENLDVECLLGVGLDDVHESSLYIDGFTAVDEEDLSRIKMEFEYDAMGDEMELCHEAQGVVVAVEERKERELCEGVVKKMGLRLDYDAVIDAWSRSGCSSPWSGGDRPQLDSDGYLPSLTGLSQAGGASWSRGRWAASGGEEREARVTRYREKRRTRLFSKKIRYEVRKLNAEKRPRMKGRFVKRTTLSAGGPGQAPYGQY